MTQPTIKKNRDSNMELLRITAMLLVMIIHASYRALPKPTPDLIAEQPCSIFLQLLTEGCAIVAVDVFVMLSGWYGIKLRLSRLAELLFQVVFFGLICLAVNYAITGIIPPHAIKTIFMLGNNDYWFVKTYLALCLLSPVLNAFVETASRRQFATVLLLFFAFQWTTGWVIDAVSWIQSGYSLPSFMALYLLARYMNVHRPRFTRFHRLTDLAIYMSTACLIAVSIFFLKKHFDLGGVLLFYNSPLVILGAASLLLFFSKLSFRSKPINWLSISVLSIYLTHSSSIIGHYYDEAIRTWHDSLSRSSFLINIIILIGSVFFGSILLDKLRLRIWKPLSKLFTSNG